MKNYDIIIIGGGWYGCHIALKLPSKYKILLIEQKSDIFCCSSYYNQNRLHEGYHYCRDYNTRILCQTNYGKFMKEYEECVENIENNHYVISNDSLMCIKTYESIYKHENFNFVYDKNNTSIKNIQGFPIIVNEKVINSDKAKISIKKKLLSQVNCKCVFNTIVRNVTTCDDAVVINNQYKAKLVLDCTYNQLNLSQEKYLYELTLSLLYEKLEKFGALTIMDGNFCSLYPRNGDIYTLTDVEFTPIKKSHNFNDIKNYVPSDEEISNTKNKMENKLCQYLPNFLKMFKYEGYFLSFKTKQISNSDTRDIKILQINDRIISVNCGKIYGIFEWEKYVTQYVDNNKETLFN